jgi:hypothetical protein
MESMWRFREESVENMSYGYCGRVRVTGSHKDHGRYPVYSGINAVSCYAITHRIGLRLEDQGFEIR